MPAYRVLFIEPYLGGSHQAFVEGWQQHSGHSFDVFGLPAYKWKWRMRHASLTIARQVNEAIASGRKWDVVVCSDMLSLTEFKGLVDGSVASLPNICYFHENQMTYPTPTGKLDERDYHFAYTNFLNACAADANWFNSRFHLEEFYGALKSFLEKMPDYPETDSMQLALEYSSVKYPGIKSAPSIALSHCDHFTILWPHRWEYDKNPKLFFEALKRLQSRLEFRLIVLGQSFRDSPRVFNEAREVFSRNIEHWGFVETSEEYWKLLSQSSIVVSTAEHEFFGMAMLEAASAGVVPVLPRRLAYPEIFQTIDPQLNTLFYDGCIDSLCESILRMFELYQNKQKWSLLCTETQELTERYLWAARAKELDEALERVCLDHEDRGKS